MSNIYVRNNKSSHNIVLRRMLFIVPLLLYGIYKNGIYLYVHKYIGFSAMFKPIIVLAGAILISLVVSFIYHIVFKRERFRIDFSLEYAILSSCVISYNTNTLYYFGVLAAVLLIMEFLNFRFNTVSIIFIILYFLTKDFSYANIYEASKEFNLDLIDYALGRGSGGLFATHALLVILSLIGLTITDNNKVKISLSSFISFLALVSVYGAVKGVNVIDIIMGSSYVFAFLIVSADYLSSPYNTSAAVMFGTFIGLISFGVFFVNPILAPYVGILVVSVFKDLFDYLANRKIRK